MIRYSANDIVVWPQAPASLVILKRAEREAEESRGRLKSGRHFSIRMAPLAGGVASADLVRMLK
jgi:hypothetical protein